MKSTMTAFAIMLALSGCSTGSADLEPIRGSITYGGHVARLNKAPVGSTMSNDFEDELGRWIQEVYVVQPDRTLKLTQRQIGQKP